MSKIFKAIIIMDNNRDFYLKLDQYTDIRLFKSYIMNILDSTSPFIMVDNDYIINIKSIRYICINQVDENE